MKNLLIMLEKEDGEAMIKQMKLEPEKVENALSDFRNLRSQFFQLCLIFPRKVEQLTKDYRQVRLSIGRTLLSHHG